MYWYDRNVEEILSPVWGWSATNDVANSNHLAGTAVDVNAPKYPWGSRVMSATLKGRVRAGLALFEGSVFWGADWSRADEMHYQMAWREGDPRNEAFAKKLLDGYLGIYKPAPTPPATTPEKGPLMALNDAEQRELLDGVRYIRDQVGPASTSGARTATSATTTTASAGHCAPDSPR
ncbi:hypothetical protein MALGJ_00040 [Mycolicibacter algericus]|uniref:Peptidase M15C domain-containing protein n=1 Tax=Mycolicibacter algericus TaxID=1288388 RepID=A0A7I9Y3U4_MYCAL|nr:hypothetical protein MALGJ_00040 [Mycolicibacter algericus]